MVLSEVQSDLRSVGGPGRPIAQPPAPPEAAACPQPQFTDLRRIRQSYDASDTSNDVFCPLRTSLDTSATGPTTPKPSKPPRKPPSRIPSYTTMRRHAPGSHPATLSVSDSKPATRSAGIQSHADPSTLIRHEQRHTDTSQRVFDEVFTRHVQNQLKMTSISRAALIGKRPGQWWLPTQVCTSTTMKFRRQ